MRKKRKTDAIEIEDNAYQFCDVCKFSKARGDIIVCDYCSTAVHLMCHSPPLLSLPKIPWCCSSCLQAPVKKINNEVLSPNSNLNGNDDKQIDNNHLG